MPSMEPGPLLSTWERWKKEGLNPELDPHDYRGWCQAFGWDNWPLSLSLEVERKHLYQEEILSQDDRTVTKRGNDGSIIRHNRGPHKTIPQLLRPAVTNLEEWRNLKAWLLEGLSQSLSQKAEDVFQKAASAQIPVCLHAGSLVGQVRNWLGFEGFCYWLYDHPSLVEDMMETCTLLAEAAVNAFGQRNLPLEEVHFWEDICYRNGPIISPHLFQKLAVPRYRRVVELARKYGYDRVSVDSDGYLWPLLPGWIEAGVTVFAPLEVQAGMDVNQVQEKYGGQVVLMGGLHKGRLTAGLKEIEAELNRVKPAVEKGGYIPCLDHNVPSDVSLRNYLIYCRLKREILSLGQPFEEKNVLG